MRNLMLAVCVGACTADSRDTCSDGVGGVHTDPAADLTPDPTDPGTSTDTDTDTTTSWSTPTEPGSDTGSSTPGGNGSGGSSAVSCDLSGRAYAWQLQDAEWVQPAALGALVYIDEELVMGISADLGDALECTVGTSSTGECTPLPLADFTTNPTFVVGPTDFTLALMGLTVPITELVLTGSFDVDCTGIHDGELEGQVDLRDLGDLLADLLGTEDPDAACALLGALGAPCAPCATDGAAYCQTLQLDDVDAVEAAPLECME